MASKRRDTLRNYFEDGKCPKEDHFRDLIDSNLNMLDEGFKKSDEHGFQIYSAVAHEAFISFFSNTGSDNPDWRIAHEGQGEHLLFQVPRKTGPTGELRTVVRLDKSGFLDVLGQNLGKRETRGGVIRSGGRQGWEPKESSDPNICTDGIWHDITGNLKGCQAFEVMAGVRDTGKGRVSLMHAIALSTFNRRNSWWHWLLRRQIGIRFTHAYWGSRCDKLELRWNGDTGASEQSRYRLQIRSKCDWRTGGGNAVPISCYLTQLWFDDADQNRNGAASPGIVSQSNGGAEPKKPSK